ncbi:hypothetical protein HPY31_22440 [Brevibacillus sp. HB1.3]|uniref:hypothetical protein n=1 Tax=Brevibacillus TaxID=55080 RepID=UPI001555530A|nr:MULTISPECIES: hypothetical protein [Brevibacillus]NQF16637.1 hypothetical protein [Brevibacillus sp. HB1.3]
MRKKKTTGESLRSSGNKNGHAVLKGIERPQATTPVVGNRRKGNVEEYEYYWNSSTQEALLYSVVTSTRRSIRAGFRFIAIIIMVLPPFFPK